MLHHEGQPALNCGQAELIGRFGDLADFDLIAHAHGADDSGQVVDIVHSLASKPIALSEASNDEAVTPL